MSKYAVIKVGANQEKVVEGDILQVPKSFSIKSINPILLSPRKGYSHRWKNFIRVLSWPRGDWWKEIKEIKYISIQKQDR